jgi:hypothetical protein
MGEANASTPEPITGAKPAPRRERSDLRLRLLLLIAGLALALWGAWGLISSYPDFEAMLTATGSVNLPPPALTLTPP